MYNQLQLSSQLQGAGHRSADLAIAFHDITEHLGEGREAWAVSRQRLASLIESGLPPAVIDRLRRLILIVDPVNRLILDVIRGDLSRLQRKTDRRCYRGKRRLKSRYDRLPYSRQ